MLKTKNSVIVHRTWPSRELVSLKIQQWKLPKPKYVKKKKGQNTPKLWDNYKMCQYNVQWEYQKQQ